MGPLVERAQHLGRTVVGPKVAQPLARWLDATFGDEDDGDERPSTDADAPTADPRSVADGSEPAEDTVRDADSDGSSVVTMEEPGSVEIGEHGEQPSEGYEEEVASGFLGVLKALAARVKNHNLVVVAAGIAFWGLLAIPAVLFSVVSIAGLVLDPETVEDQVDDSLDGLPTEVRTIIGRQLANVSGGSTGGLLTGLIVGLVLALWTSSGAMAKLMSTLNTIYGTTEERSFIRLRGTALVLTIGAVVFVSASMFLLAILPAVLGAIDAVGDSANVLLSILRFPLLALSTTIAFGVLYHVGPDRRGSRYRVVTLGAFVATVLWVVLSGVFSIYTSTVGAYNETYGTLGGLVVLLLWLFITAFVILVGAEIHALTGPSDQNDE